MVSNKKLTNNVKTNMQMSQVLGHRPQSYEQGARGAQGEESTESLTAVTSELDL